MNDKIIFLDIDGVLNHVNTKEPVDPQKLELLKFIVDSTQSKIVLSSSWRVCNEPGTPQYSQWLYLLDMLQTENLSISDVTPYKEFIRPLEISLWLKDHPEVTSWVSLDDDFLPEDYEDEGLNPERLILTTYFGPGLTLSHAKKAIKLLNEKGEQNENN